MGQHRNIAFALMVAFAVAVGLYWWIRPDEPPPVPPPIAAPSSRLSASRTEPMRPVTRPSLHARDPSPASPAPVATEPAAPPAPTPPVVDLATLPRSSATEEESKDEDRFPTNEWFTQEDQQHPEIYFELAERMPELNRPEERRQTLAFFLAYRDKLRRDLGGVGENQEKRKEILAALERYDGAIARLGKLIDTEAAK